MATPIFKNAAVNPTFTYDSPNSVFFPSVDTAGNPVDISSGYTIAQFHAGPATDRNTNNTGTNLAGVGSFVFGSTGLTWNVANSATPDLQALHSAYALLISNDSNATRAILSSGIITMQNPAGLIQ